MKGKLKNIFVAILAIISMVLICISLGFFSRSDDDIIINRIVGVVAIVSGIGSVIIGVSSIFSASLDNVREYYATGDTKEMSDARHILYNYRYIKIKYGKTIFDDDFDEWVKNNISANNSVLRVTNKDEILHAVSETAGFFQMWGLLQYRHFLPMWVFETASGYSIIKLYEASADIFARNRMTNPFYAMQYRNLCIRVSSKYKKDISKCRECESEYIKNVLGIEDLSNNKYFNIPLK